MEHINTLKYYEELKGGGVPEEQARTQTYALNSALDHLATKEDLFVTNKEIKEVKAEVKEIKGDLRKMFYTLVSGMVALFLKLIVDIIIAATH